MTFLYLLLGVLFIAFIIDAGLDCLGVDDE